MNIFTNAKNFFHIITASAYRISICFTAYLCFKSGGIEHLNTLPKLPLPIHSSLLNLLKSSLICTVISALISLLDSKLWNELSAVMLFSIMLLDLYAIKMSATNKIKHVTTLIEAISNLFDPSPCDFGTLSIKKIYLARSFISSISKFTLIILRVLIRIFILVC